MKSTPANAADCCAALLDSRFFKAFSEPARNDVFREVVLLGRADIGTIASRLPQDRSVVSRHLQKLTEAGAVRASRVGRRICYQVNVDEIERRLAEMLEITRQLRQALPTEHSPEDEK